jgi:ABC-2 type transport system permease protein
VALFFGDTVAAEASWSSLRYLLAAPIPRARLLRQKAVVAGLLSVTALLLLPVVALRRGHARVRRRRPVTPTGESLPFWPGRGRVLLGALYVAIQLSWVAALALLLSVSTDAPLGAVGGAVMVSIVSQILTRSPRSTTCATTCPRTSPPAWSGLLADQIDWRRHDPRCVLGRSATRWSSSPRPCGGSGARTSPAERANRGRAALIGALPEYPGGAR